MFRKVNKNFFKKWSSEMAYVLGFFAADGYITVNKRGGQFWSIQIVDKKLLENIKKTVGSGHKISTMKRRKIFGGEVSFYIIYRLQIGSIEMCDDLRHLGMCENKTKSLTVPNVPDKYFSDFVRGYFDGDGNVWLGNVNKIRKIPKFTIIVMFTSCSFVFLDQLRKKLLKFGLKGGSLYRSKRNYSRLQFSVLDSLKLYDFMYNSLRTSKLFLKRKKDVFEKYVKMRL